MKLRWAEEITLAEANKRLSEWSKDEKYNVQKLKNGNVTTYFKESTSTYIYLVLGKKFACITEFWKK